MNHDVKTADRENLKVVLFADIEGIGGKGLAAKVCRGSHRSCNRVCLPAGGSEAPGERQTNKTASYDQNRPRHPAPYNEDFPSQKAHGYRQHLVRRPLNPLGF